MRFNRGTSRFVASLDHIIYTTFCRSLLFGQTKPCNNQSLLHSWAVSVINWWFGLILHYSRLNDFHSIHFDVKTETSNHSRRVPLRLGGAVCRVAPRRRRDGRPPAPSAVRRASLRTAGEHQLVPEQRAAGGAAGGGRAVRHRGTRRRPVLQQRPAGGRRRVRLCGVQRPQSAHDPRRANGPRHRPRWHGDAVMMMMGFLNCANFSYQFFLSQFLLLQFFLYTFF